MRALLLIFIVSLAARPASGQDELRLSRLEAPIRLDGQIDDDEWPGVQSLPMTQYAPEFGKPPSEETEILIGYDDSFLYVAARMLDSEASGIRANTLYRDKYSGDDTFGLVLDPFNDNENGLWFFTTPNGVRVDMAISGDGEGGFESMNSSWNTYWDVSTSRDEAGWYAEIRIPYSSLGFIDESGLVRMGLISYRFISRKNERHIFPAIDPSFRMGFAKPSQAQTILLEGVKSRKPLYITPYLAAGATGINTLNSAGTAYEIDGNYTSDVGLDLKQTLGSNLTLDLTVNTDFAQVEADDQQVNLTRFSLFFPEKRQFFQERAGLFDFSTGRTDRLFHSRSIGLSEYGPVPIIGGGRVVGRIGEWDVGLIEMQTARATFDVDDVRETVPSENFGVLRLRRRLLNDYSSAGGIVTSRIAEDGGYNVAFGLDGTFRLFGDDYVTLQFAQTFDDVSDADFDDAALARLWWERRTQAGLSYRGGATYSGNAYNPGVGFSTRDDYFSPRIGVGYGWFPGEKSLFRRVSPSSLWRAYYRRADSSLESAFWLNSLALEFKTGHNLTLEAEYQLDDLTSQVDFPEDTTVPAGTYEFVTGSAKLRMPAGSVIRGNADVSFGTFYDGTRAEIQIAPSFIPVPFLELETSYRYNRVDFTDRNQAFDVHLARIRAQIGFNTKVSLNGYIQVNSAADVVSTNARFRYNFREGNDLWLVYNSGFNLDRQRENPFLPVTRGRMLLLKYTYTFIR
ncbi:MAG: hypothetical protein ACI9W4_000759 [Rhodothermales bacterium]|jgi:hypothetical protein